MIYGLAFFALGVVLITIGVISFIKSENEQKQWLKKSFQQYCDELTDKKIKLTREYEERKKYVEEDFKQFQEDYELQKSVLNTDLTFLHNTIETVNNQIKIEKRAKESKAEHFLQLSDKDIKDIRYLLDLQDVIVKKDIIPKIIWSGYLMDAFNTMFKLQFNEKKKKNAIYLIENEISKEKYIGRTVNVHDRWVDHIKTSLGIGGAQSALHRSMYDAWNDFSFTILESGLTTEQMKEREKFYIEFYESNVYGYNQNRGG